MAAAVGLAGVLLGRAFGDLEFGDGEDHVDGVGAAGDFLAVAAVADGLWRGVSRGVLRGAEVKMAL